MTLLFSLILLFQACDWFGGEDDKPQKKSTEFVFTVDTLRQFTLFEVNDVDVIDDTSFVVTGFFVEEDKDENIINEYNQIWWGKKKGYEFRSLPQLAGDNTIITTSRISYFAGNALYQVYGGSSRYSIFENGVYKHQRLQDGTGFFAFDNIELIRPGEFYLYGRNGSLVYYKDGTFSKIDIGSRFNIDRSAIRNDTLLLFAIQDSIPLYGDMSQYYEQILTIVKGNIISTFQSDLSLQPNKPVLFRSIHPYQNKWIIGSNTGIYTFTSTDEFTLIKPISVYYLHHDLEGNFIFKRQYDDQHVYWDGQTETVLPNFQNNVGFNYTAYKGRLFLQVIFYGYLKVIIIGEQQ